jgi:hypothetical protein
MFRLIWLLLLSAVFIVVLSGCSDDPEGPAVPDDDGPPTTVTNLSVAAQGDTAVVLSWTAPTDRGPSAEASAYDIRYSPSYFSKPTWESATQVLEEPKPKPPGETESFTVPGLSPDTSYYFGLKTRDQAGNISEVSNIVLLDVDPPDPITNLQVIGVTAHTVSLSWMAPADNGSTTRANSYDVRFSPIDITEQNWEAATTAANPPTPSNPGTTEHFVVLGLNPDSLMYFAVRSRDDKGNLSSLSNVVAQTTLGTGQWTGFNQQGTNATVTSLYPFNGDLVVGGAFTQVGLVLASSIATWNGQQWSALGFGFSNTVGFAAISALTEYNGQLISGGIYDRSGLNTPKNIARWDGTEWLSLGSGANLWVRTLAVYQGSLYVGGNLTVAGGLPSPAIARWDGSSWHAMGWQGRPNVQFVWDLTVYNGELIAAGSFTSAATTAANSIASWNGSRWAALGDGFTTSGDDARVYAVCVDGEDLIASGDFELTGGTPVNNIARWNGASWIQMGDGIGVLGSYDHIMSMAVYNGTLYVGGYFSVAGGQPANNIAYWDGTDWNPVEEGLTGSSPVARALALYDGGLFVGGEFTTAGGVSANNLARWDE